MSDGMKGALRGVKNEIVNFAFAALKSGAANVGKELVNVTSVENQNEKEPSSMEFKTFANALKTGIMGTGQDLMTLGRERIGANSPQEQNPEKSE